MSDYGFTKLAALFSAIDSTVEIVVDKSGDKIVQLKSLPQIEHTSTKKSRKGKKKVMNVFLTL
jgi:hypothetical protein